MMPPIRILGIDPGLRRMGWGLVTSEGMMIALIDLNNLLPSSMNGAEAACKDNMGRNGEQHVLV